MLAFFFPDQVGQDFVFPQTCLENAGRASGGMPSCSTEQNEQQNHQGNGGDEMQTFTASRPNEIKKLKLSKQQQKANQPGSGRRNTVNNTKKRSLCSIGTNR